MKKDYQSSRNNNDNQSFILLRRGWSVRKLWILSIIGLAGLGLDAVFHTLDSGTPLTIIFDGADFSTGQMVATVPLPIFALAVTGHLTFLSAFALLVVLPKLFFEKSPRTQSDGGHRTWAVLKEGRSIKQLWFISMVGVAGIVLDVTFHWLQDGSPDQVLLNGFDNPDPLVSALAISAHTMFIGAFALLIFLPKILFAKTPEAPPIAK
jgi:hypothetical protein